METNTLLDGMLLPEYNKEANEATASLLFPSSEPAQIEANTELSSYDSKEELAKREEQKRLIEEHNRRIMSSPEYKASILLHNYLATTQHILSGSQKRSLYRKFLRDVKGGKYDYLFDEEKMRRREERARAKFDKLNKPAVHTVDEVPDDVKDRLVALADSDEWKHTKPEEAI